MVVLAAHLVALAVLAIGAIDLFLTHIVSHADHTAGTAKIIKMFALDVGRVIESGSQITIASHVHLFVIPATRIKIYVHPAIMAMKYSKSISQVKKDNRLACRFALGQLQ